MRELILENPEDQDFNLHFMVEYLNEQKFNAYLKNDEGFLIPVILDAEINMNPDKPDSVLVRTDSEQYRVDYFIDKDGKVITLDYESSPYPIVVKKSELVKEEAHDGGIAADHIKSPMPGTVAKVYVKPG